MELLSVFCGLEPTKKPSCEGLLILEFHVARENIYVYGWYKYPCTFLLFHWHFLSHSLIYSRSHHRRKLHGIHGPVVQWSSGLQWRCAHFSGGRSRILENHGGEPTQPGELFILHQRWPTSAGTYEKRVKGHQRVGFMKKICIKICNIYMFGNPMGWSKKWAIPHGT